MDGNYTKKAGRYWALGPGMPLTENPIKMMKKHILDSKHLRRVPARFSWVDHQLIRARLLCGADCATWALYLFLITVGDEHGLSYYSDASACSHLNLCGEDLRKARRQLLERRLIAWEAPLYQVLGVQTGRQSGQGYDNWPKACAPQAEQNEPPAMSAKERHINGLRLARVLGEIMEGGKQ